jgi:hypothetical protein
MQVSSVDLTFGGQLKLTAEGKKFQTELNKLLDHEVAVGFIKGEDPYEDGTDLCDVAMYNEFGTSTIPPRPFMEQGINNHMNLIQQAMNRAFMNVDAGGDAETGLDWIGLAGKRAIQEEMVSGNFVPNAPSTIKKKGSSQPTIDTGHMRQNVQYYIRQAGETK